MTRPADAQWAEYALDLLPRAQRAELDRELARSPDARAALRDALASLETLALAAEPVTPSEALDARIAALSSPGPERLEGFVDRLCALFDLDAERVREHLRRVANAPEAPWEPSGTPGVWLYHFTGGPRVASADCGLVYHEPGAAFPRHGHVGEERALVLSGAAITDGGETWVPGSVGRAGPETHHGFRATDDGPFVFAVVVEGRIRIDRD